MTPPRWVDDDGQRCPRRAMPSVRSRHPREATEGGAGPRVPAPPAEWLTRQEQALEGERMTSPELDIDYDSSQKLG